MTSVQALPSPVRGYTHILGRGGTGAGNQNVQTKTGKQQTYHFIQNEMRSNREEEREGGGGSIIHEGNSSTTELAQTSCRAG